LTLHYSTFSVLDSTLLYIGSTSLHMTLHYSTTILLHFTWLYFTPT